MKGVEENRLELRDLTVGYGGEAVLRGVTAQLRPGEIVTLIGPNGAGKSTLLRTLVRALPPVAGAVLLDGRRMETLRPGEIAKEVSLLMTERLRGGYMTCFDAVLTGRYPYTGRLGVYSEHDRAVAEEMVERLRLTPLRERPFDRISDGQRQRVMLARALCQEPGVLVMDEPTTYLDLRHKLELLSLLRELVRERRIAVLLSLHELDLAQKISDWLLCVREGVVDRVGTPEEIFDGGYIDTLYGVEHGGFNERYGCAELEAVQGEPVYFVVGGGGSGCAVYRLLQRRGIPFAAGVLAENDLDYPAAKALAVTVIAERAYQSVSEASRLRAMEVAEHCRGVIDCVKVFGPMNEGNRLLLDWARQQGKLIAPEDIPGG